MRQNHKAGEKLFVDYCGPTMSIVDGSTGVRCGHGGIKLYLCRNDL
jgi:hypothetical protein